jgi:hypothetical protein
MFSERKLVSEIRVPQFEQMFEKKSWVVIVEGRLHFGQVMRN